MNGVGFEYSIRQQERLTSPLSRLSIIFLFFFLILFTGCTSLGHEGRVQPQIERPLAVRPDVVTVSGSGELVIAIELLLVSRGINVRASPIQVLSDESSETLTIEAASRYVVNVNSVDHEMCIPEGSRQMHFYVSVVDLVENQRVFAMSGDYGCKDTIVKRFERWFFQ